MKKYTSWSSAGNRFTGFLLLSLAFAGCTDAQLKCVTADCDPGKGAAADNVVSAQGNVCTADPGTLTYPYKILFVVDVSGSTIHSDLTNGRSAAVQRVINQYISNPAVSFALIEFDTQPNALIRTFTRDQTVLNNVIPQLNQHLNFTNYLDTLTMATQMIQDDAATLTPGERTRTRYDVQWLSDGQPYPCQTIDQVRAAEAKLMGLTGALGVLDVRLSSIELDFPNNMIPADDVVTNCGTTTEQQYLMQMATDGRGTFQELQSNQLKFQINYTQIVRPFSKRAFFLVNQSRVVQKGELLADSDQDGVPDATEKTMSTDPTQADPNNTGCSDRTRQLLLPNKNICEDGCRVLITQGGSISLDSDQDTLHDCEETALGTRRDLPDTDGDTLPDAIETRFGTDALDGRTAIVDSDQDGVTDFQEVLNGTDPLTAEPNHDLAYVYAPLQDGTAGKPGTSCYNFTVSNVRLAATTATPKSAEGDNELCMYVVQSPIDDPNGETTVTRACKTANYKVVNGKDVKAPANGVVQFGSQDFVPFICPEGKCAL